MFDYGEHKCVYSLSDGVLERERTLTEACYHRIIWNIDDLKVF